MLALDGSPYAVSPAAESSLLGQVRELERRIELLRGERLTDETLERYYNNTRMIDVTESNAIEGSTLSLQETERAVAKGTTLTGHDPGYIRDAKALFKAFERLAELARTKEPTDIEQVKEIHELILGDRPGAGNFRSEPVRISGAVHVPPPDWRGVMRGMEDWWHWSRDRHNAPAPLRATVLHAWLAHIHPFIDGNGRTARAITTLELVRAGYPPPIIRKKDRKRYYGALAEADQGDLAPMLDLMLSRCNDAIRDLERAAGAAQGYSPVVAAFRNKQQSQLAIWNKAVELLIANVEAGAQELAEAGRGAVLVRSFGPEIDLDDYVALCENRSISDAWAFEIDLRLPGSAPVSRLAWIGFRSDDMVRALGTQGAAGPTLFWSAPNPAGMVPRWRKASAEESPGGEEITYSKDGWVARKAAKLEPLGASDLAARILRDLVTMS